MAPATKPAPTLATLPSELRRIIVTYLAPATPDDIVPGCKTDLKNANIAHRCLKEWVPEVMFRDMALEHVISGQASHLERFSVRGKDADLFRHVRNIQVKVPPAIRWEIDTATDFDTLEDLTARRLCKKFGVVNPDSLTKEDRWYCESYHRALVEPFVDNRRWYMLLKNAQWSWPDIFSAFPNLQEIGVGCCERVDHPVYTYTNIFVTRHGRDVVSEVEPRYVEDSTVNMGWASATVLACVPASVRSLRLTMSNMDNFNSFATVNRLLNIVYSNATWLIEDPPLGITRLSVTLRGIHGVHGMHGLHDIGTDTGSHSSVRYYTRVLLSLSGLQHLEFHQDLESDQNLAFTDGEDTNTEENAVIRVVAKVKHPRLQTLELHGFTLEYNTLLYLFQENGFLDSPSLRKIVFDNIVLSITGESECTSNKTYRHIMGYSWRRLCADKPRLQIVLRNPSSTMSNEENYAIHPVYVKEIQSMPGVALDLSGCYTSTVLPPPEIGEGLLSRSMKEMEL
ncbi:hypothetical protein K458DRAFT_387847 [Lentithecium fluviatile CBS 122367]|uniref:Uncharacterized protein n=1 Tax=Lentithecium fluviatile CBS 122367 TaxID=1168545 RepID=A0A6G1J6S5_9PLEO|nr:hypothetical protein K458DRAFT_387847 [Lentithecium fluviatile CBS 122367]